jgi:MFS transporter, DHA2 family, multidrug resistance protein
LGSCRATGRLARTRLRNYEIFWVNLPFAVAVAVAAIAVTMSAVRESRNPDDCRRLDGPGVAASALGLVAVTLGLTESASRPWGSWPVAAPLLTGGVFLASL